MRFLRRRFCVFSLMLAACSVQAEAQCDPNSGRYKFKQGDELLPASQYQVVPYDFQDEALNALSEESVLPLRETTLRDKLAHGEYRETYLVKVCMYGGRSAFDDKDSFDRWAEYVSVKFAASASDQRLHSAHFALGDEDTVRSETAYLVNLWYPVKTITSEAGIAE